jgi:hypothetical protein
MKSSGKNPPHHPAEKHLLKKNKARSFIHRGLIEIILDRLPTL